MNSFNVKIGDIIVCTSIENLSNNEIGIFYILDSIPNKENNIKTWYSINNVVDYNFNLGCLKAICSYWKYEHIAL